MSFTPNAAGFYSIAIDVLVFSDEELFERLVHAVIAVSEKQLGSVASASLGMVGDSAHLVLNANLGPSSTEHMLGKASWWIATGTWWLSAVCGSGILMFFSRAHIHYQGRTWNGASASK